MVMLQEGPASPPQEEEKSILAKIMALIKGDPPAELSERTIASVRERFPEQAETIIAGERTPEEMGAGQAISLARSTTPQPRLSRASQLQSRLTEAAGDKTAIQQIHDEASQLMEGASPGDKKKLQQVVILAQRALRQ